VSALGFLVSAGGNARHALGPLVFIGVLLVLLVEREIVRARGGRASRAAADALGFAIVPLLVALVIFMTLRFVAILGL
jgi:hypothetical protein